MAGELSSMRFEIIYDVTWDRYAHRVSPSGSLSFEQAKEHVERLIKKGAEVALETLEAFDLGR